jgi:hypothetical protein
MQCAVLHTGGVVGSIPTAPTIYPVDIAEKSELYDFIVQLRNLPQTTGTSPKHQGKPRGSVRLSFPDVPVLLPRADRVRWAAGRLHHMPLDAECDGGLEIVIVHDDAVSDQRGLQVGHHHPVRPGPSTMS